jgi:5-methylcytosine-specific restriction protein A
MAWKGGPSRTSTAEWKATRKRILERDGRRCRVHDLYCTGLATQVDHIIPVSRGGSELDSNLQSVCASCHRRKSQRESSASKRANPNNRKARPREKHPGLL